MRLSIVFITFAIAVTGAGGAQVLSEADAYVRDGSYSDTNYGSEVDLAVAAGATGENREGFMRFDAAGQTPVASATLRVAATPNATEFDVTGAIYYAVAPAAFTYGSEQNIAYGVRKFTSLASAIAALDTTPSAPQVINILGNWDGSPEVGVVTIDGIATTTANFLLVRALGEARHQGRWTGSAYVLEHPGTSGWALQIEDSNVTVQGLQVYMPNAPTTAGGAVRARQRNILIDACIARGPGLYTSTGSNYGSGFNVRDNPSGSTCYIRNSVAFGWLTNDITEQLTAYAFNMHPGSGDSVILHNCTAYGSDYGFRSWSGVVTVINCLAQSCTNGFEGTFTTTSDYNGSDLTGDAPGANTIIGLVQFADEGNADFHLTTSARWHAERAVICRPTAIFRSTTTSTVKFAPVGGTSGLTRSL